MQEKIERRCRIDMARVRRCKATGCYRMVELPKEYCQRHVHQEREYVQRDKQAVHRDNTLHVTVMTINVVSITSIARSNGWTCVSWC